MASFIQRLRRCCCPHKSFKAMPMPSHPIPNSELLDDGEQKLHVKVADPLSLVAVRKPVPKDNNCLFRAMAYLAEDGNDCSDAVAARLREVCAINALADDDPTMRALLLGFDTVEEYASWIRNDTHWGGENEVLVLAKHYNLEVSIVCCRSLQVMCYGADEQACKKKGRVYLLYTGEHYDPLVASSASFQKEVECFPPGDTFFEAAALEFAKSYLSDKEWQATRCPRCGMMADRDHRCNGFHFKQSGYAARTGSMY